jgi:hypothetical protein
MALIISQIARQGQHLLFLFFPLDTKRKLDTTDRNKVDTANPLCLDELVHVPILQESVDARKGGNAFSFFLFILAFIPSYDIIAAAAFAAACNCRANGFLLVGLHRVCHIPCNNTIGTKHKGIVFFHKNPRGRNKHDTIAAITMDVVHGRDSLTASQCLQGSASR